MSENNVVLVTGVSSGIGRATSEMLSEQGFKAYGTMRRPNEAEVWPGKVELVQLDVRDEESVRFCVKTAGETTDRVGPTSALPMPVSLFRLNRLKYNNAKRGLETGYSR